MGTITGIQPASSNYWLASRDIDSNSSYCGFYVRYANSSGALYDYRNLCNVNSYGNTYGNSNSNASRPVFTLKPGIKVTEGDGNNIPYTLIVP